MSDSTSVSGTPTRMKVAVRLRPVLKQDDKDKEPCVRGLDATSLEIWNWRDTKQTIKYNFDVFFDATSRQQDIHEKCVKPLMAKALRGQNASIFAYGPTGAGKTHTMLGTVERPGIIPRAVNDIFRLINKQKLNAGDAQWMYSLSFSYLEIYQEKVYDLLEVKGQDLPIREDRDRTIFIPNLAERVITSLEEFHDLFVPASKNRTTAATKLNSRSSRSHSILLLKVVKKQEAPPYKKQIGKVYLIDLAGSENNKRTGNRGIRLKESGAINTSLFVLGQVVDALNQGLGRVPYRDSKLTRLLQDSLGGSAHACMITNIAPEESNYMETYTALNFASKSRHIVNKPFTNEITERPTAQRPAKRSSSGEERHQAASSPPRKKAKRDSNEQKVTNRPESAEGSTKQQENAPFLSPLLRRQANFEESMKSRLQALENNIMTRLNPPANQGQAHQSHDLQNRQILEQLKESSKQLSQLQKQNSKFHQVLANSRMKDQDHLPQRKISSDPSTKKTSSGVAGSSLGQPATLPKAVVKPLTMSTQHNFAPQPTTKSNLLKRRAPDVQFMKIKTCDDPKGKSLKENAHQLQPNPELQAKHTAEIIHLLNTGSVKQLKSLQSVGEKRAQLIRSWRQMFGEFTTISDLKKVNGLPSKTVDAIIRNNLLCQGIAKG
ncbi:kinesin-like protein KIF22 [Acanthaster planci]|uniref:Kinesin-like protein n=1 Tax=Acanthaster planci TaxID=133434 RepID=A0A8B7Y0X8_ACAPL|nr:kinesin-like protein KIF22 [Acanthaster planci]XP_022085620.1 kinesin-like protein KIF22 [Acanthaster planci]XP_022085621.1 kinesin-like protein KIF22 [Acanthaster planci]